MNSETMVWWRSCGPRALQSMQKFSLMWVEQNNITSRSHVFIVIMFIFVVNQYTGPKNHSINTVWWSDLHYFPTRLPQFEYCRVIRWWFETTERENPLESFYREVQQSGWFLAWNIAQSRLLKRKLFRKHAVGG